MPDPKNCRIDLQFNTNANGTAIAPPTENGLAPPQTNPAWKGVSSTNFQWYTGLPGGTWSGNGEKVDDLAMPVAVIGNQELVINILDQRLSTVASGAVVEVAAYTSSNDTSSGTRTPVAVFQKYCWGSGTPGINTPALTDPSGGSSNTAVVLTSSQSFQLAGSSPSVTIATLQFVSPATLNGIVNPNKTPKKIFLNVAVYFTMNPPGGAASVNCWEDPEMEIDAGTSTMLELKAGA